MEMVWKVLWIFLLPPLCARQDDDSTKAPFVALLYDQMGDGLVAELRLKRPNAVETVVKCFDGNSDIRWRGVSIP